MVRPFGSKRGLFEGERMVTQLNSTSIRQQHKLETQK